MIKIEIKQSHIDDAIKWRDEEFDNALIDNALNCKCILARALWDAGFSDVEVGSIATVATEKSTRFWFTHASDAMMISKLEPKYWERVKPGIVHLIPQ